jgi:hypothetical protein
LKNGTKIAFSALVASGLFASGVVAAPVVKEYVLKEFNVSILADGKTYTDIGAPIMNHNGTTYVPLRSVGDLIGATVTWNGELSRIEIRSKATVTASPSSAPQKEIIGKADLPYKIDATNGMSLSVNSYTASSGGIEIDITLTNNSTVSDKGDDMVSVYEIYDGKNTLETIGRDRIFVDTNYIRSGQSITGKVSFKGLSHETDTFTLYGGLWQYVDREEFEITFKVE